MLLLGCFRSRHRLDHHHALAVGREVPTRALGLLDPHAGLLRLEGISFGGVGRLHNAAPGTIQQSTPVPRPYRDSATVVRDLPFASLPRRWLRKSAHIDFGPSGFVRLIRDPVAIRRE